MFGNCRQSLANILMLTAFGGTLAPCVAQDVGTKDPARWYAEDATPQARYQTSTKEAHAAYQEALKDCRQMKGPERAACLKEAHANLQTDLTDAKRKLRH